MGLRCHDVNRRLPMGSKLTLTGSTRERSAGDELLAVRFWMNGMAQTVQVERSRAQRCRRDLLSTGAVLLN